MTKDPVCGVEVDTEDAVNNRLDGIKLTLNVARLSVSGIVVDMDDKPVAGANVSCYPANQFSSIHPWVQTDLNGKFTIDKICPGRVRVTADVGGQTRLYGSVETEGGAKDVKIVVKERTLSPPMESKRPPSLMRRPLPGLKEFKIELPPVSADDTKILVCFWDMEQRPSRRCILELARQAEQLKKDGVIVVAVQASGVDEDILNDWVEKNDISFPVGMIQGDEEKVKSSWGIRSLPWLILTDAERVVRSRGFSIDEGSLGLDAIHDVGHGGDFLSHGHTAKFYKTEQWQPMFRNRLDIQTWKNQGSKNYGDIVTQKAREILKNYKPEPLPEQVLQELSAIRKKAERLLLDKHFKA